MESRAGTLSIDGERVRVPRDVFDHDGFRRWATSDTAPEDVRVAFVAGEVLLQISPEAIESHNKAKGKIREVLGRLIDEEDRGEWYSDGVLPSNEEAVLSTEPDFVFASWGALEQQRVRLVPKAGADNEYVELAGSPDLVVEVVSASSVRKDCRLLRAAYQRAGIPEYWLIDARGESISFQILWLGPGGYEPVAADGQQPQTSRVLQRAFCLSRERNRAGRWRYSLDIVKPGSR